MGRPATKPKKLKDGYYIEIKNKGDKSGIKVYSPTKMQMQRAIKMYERSKEIVILGESKNGKWVNDKPIPHQVEV